MNIIIMNHFKHSLLVYVNMIMFALPRERILYFSRKPFGPPVTEKETEENPMFKGCPESMRMQQGNIPSVSKPKASVTQII